MRGESKQDDDQSMIKANKLTCTRDLYIPVGPTCSFLGVSGDRGKFRGETRLIFPLTTKNDNLPPRSHGSKLHDKVKPCN